MVAETPAADKLDAAIAKLDDLKTKWENDKQNLDPAAANLAVALQIAADLEMLKMDVDTL